MDKKVTASVIGLATALVVGAGGLYLLQDSDTGALVESTPIEEVSHVSTNTAELESVEVVASEGNGGANVTSDSNRTDTSDGAALTE